MGSWFGIPLVVSIITSTAERVTVVEVRAELEYEIRFHDVVLVRSNADVMPGAFPIVTYLGDGAVFVRWQGPSQGCLDYGFTLLRLRARSRVDVRHCARLEPEIVVRDGRVIVTSPAYRTFDGDAIAAKTWTL